MQVVSWDSPVESRNFVVRFSSQRHPCDISRSEDQRKRNPGSQEAGKHLQTSGNQERHDKEIHNDHKADKNDRRLEWRSVMEPLEVDQRHERILVSLRGTEALNFLK